MRSSEEALTVLADRSAPLATIVKAVSSAEAATAQAPEVRIGISSSVTMDLLGLFLRREALLSGLRATVVSGGYDDPIGDMARFSAEGIERVVMMPFFDNILPSFESQLELMTDTELEAKEAELSARYQLAFQHAAAFRSVQVGLYHRFGRPAVADGVDRVSTAIARLNDVLRKEASAAPNVQLIDVATIVEQVGRASAFDPRFYYRSKAPYSAAFLSALAIRLARASRGFGTYFYKALALDCDNTLWGGVIGEDLLEGIKLDPYDGSGSIFWRVQKAIAALEQSGLLLCLCTKNNPDDVAEVFRKHPNMVLKEDQIVAKRVNWQDKVSNLQALADELNIGLDSMIFLDDSPVEAESVRTRLPMVRMMQVPSALPDYPALIEEIAELYLAGGVAADSRSKTQQYRQRADAAAAKAAFGTHEDYLASLELEAELHINRLDEVPRISELSMKSNQFNLTTRRYSEADVKALMAGPDSEVISITVKNKFGNAGITGVLALRFGSDGATVENFLMSCRVLGQGIELSLWPTIVARCVSRGCTSLKATYLPTAKNAQVREFYDRLGMKLDSEEAGARRYNVEIEDFKIASTPWVKVTHA